MPTGLQAILQAANSIPLNQNDPATQQQSLDPFAILQQMTGATPQAPPQQGKVAAILEALATGVGTGFAHQPAGQALLGQVGQARQRRDQLADAERQRIERERLLGQQFALEEAAQQLREKRQIAGEARAEGYAIRKDAREEEARVRQFNMELSGKEKLANIQFQQQKELADIETASRLRVQDDAQEFNQAIFDVERKDKRSADLLRNTVDLIQFGMEAGTAYSIVKKFQNDQELTAAEKKSLTAAGIKARRAASGRGSGGGSVGVSNKDMSKLFTDFMNTPQVMLEDGTVTEASSIPVGVTGERVGVTKNLSAVEKAQYWANNYAPALGAAMGRQPQQQQVKGSPIAVTSQALDVQIQQLRRNNVPDSEINKMLSELETAKPDTAEAITGAKLRAGLAHKFKPKKSTQQPARQSVGGLKAPEK